MKESVVVLFLVLANMCFAQEKYTLHSGSSLAINGNSTVHSWTVKAKTIEGELNFDDGRVSDIVFEVEVAQIISEQGTTMDKKMHNALKKELHPKVIFKSQETDWTKTSDDIYVLKGVLNIAGVENEVSISAKIKRLNGVVQIIGEKKIKLQNYDMEPPTAMFGSIVVGDDVVIKFDLVFSKE